MSFYSKNCIKLSFNLKHNVLKLSELVRTGYMQDLKPKLIKRLRNAGEGMTKFFQTPSKERVVSCVMEEGGGQ